ncbi:diflavin flavoprotein [Leptolyngbya cf. ectocarpi LEGE 11479]|uniref:Diflavin flavoprotein n=1 Tax=Leptolyngbya cf. ectocarpi LEGE 11479 TaxID=1828722 RepID=A0A928X4F8_LEPEC|nr:diflavin flavoprotein [Leptolyngbya ectocarpi]MBE9066383.1 diflavin flavoprotein [Leptolyngbya cf. ectocarpi LEGE 11479]
MTSTLSIAETTSLPTAKVRPRDVQVDEIGLDTRVLRSRTWDRLKFEVEYGRRRGTTANSYIIIGDQTAILDPPGESFTDIYLESLQQQIDVATLDYIVASHVNSNRIATLKQLCILAPQATIICSRPAANVLKTALPNNPISAVRSGDCLDLGQNHRLQFVTVPTPRWPDGLCTYDPASKILYTDKLFSAHVCSDTVWDTDWRKLNSDRRYYFDCLQAPQAKQVETALKAFEAFTPNLLAPGHGSLIRHSLSRFYQDYRQWCQEQTQRQLRVAVLYASAYGSTATMANAIAQTLTESELAVELINCEHTPADALAQTVADCDGFIIGSPTLGGHAPVQVQTALGTILTHIAKTKLVGVFGSYGWSGEAIDLLANKLRDAGYRFGFEPLRIKFSPDEEGLNTCREAATRFAQQLRKRSRQQSPRQTARDAQANRTAQAMGRIIGSLGVITFEHHGENRAILTSWVSQASFTPPGIMVALPLGDGAIASLQTDRPFVLNILKEGRRVRRHFSCQTSCQVEPKPLSTERTDSDKLILTDALAYLQCLPKTHTVAGDHLLIYAQISSGDLLESDGLTALQHRQTGSQY